MAQIQHSATPEVFVILGAVVMGNGRMVSRVSSERVFDRWTAVRPRFAQITRIGERDYFADDGRKNLAVVRFMGNRLELGTVGGDGGVRFAFTSTKSSDSYVTPEVFFPVEQIISFYRRVKSLKYVGKDGKNRALNGALTVSFSNDVYEFLFVGDDDRTVRFTTEPYVKEGTDYSKLPQAPVFERRLGDHIYFADGFTLLDLVSTVREFLRGVDLVALNYDPKAHSFREYVRTLRFILPDRGMMRFVVLDDFMSEEFVVRQSHTYQPDLWLAVSDKALKEMSRVVVDDFDSDVRTFVFEMNTYRGVRPASLLIISPYFKYRLPLRLVNREEILAAMNNET